MSNRVRDHLTDHEYDGIREYDNPAPTWWHLLFLGTFVFSVFYFLYYTFSYNAPTLHDRWQDARAENQAVQFGSLGTLSPDEPTLLKYAADEEWLPFGRSVYKTNCVSCHAAEGQGSVGPNLTDDYYKSVETITDIAQVVLNGANNGAMPAWNTRLNSNEIVLVSAYVASLRGENLAGPRVAGDKEIPPWPAVPGPAAGEPPTEGVAPAEGQAPAAPAGDEPSAEGA